MDKLEWKKRKWPSLSLILVCAGCVFADIMGLLFLREKSTVFVIIVLFVEIFYIVMAVTAMLISYRDEDQYEEIREDFKAELSKRDEELRKRDNKLLQRQMGIRKMVYRYLSIKSDHGRLESRCSQLEAENRELKESNAKLRSEKMRLRGENMELRKQLPHSN